MSPKVKQPQKINKLCNNCFSPVNIKYNFSYIVYEDNFIEEYQLQFLKRIRELSSEPYNIIATRNKCIAFEFEDKDKLGINKEIPSEFNKRFPSKVYNNKFAIFRLYTNDNPILARIIGVMINKIFYVFFIDIGGNLYSH